MPRVTIPADAVVLDPTDEFESILCLMTKMHRTKSAMYGARGDKMANFYNVAKSEGITPLQAVSALGAKHRSVKREITWGHSRRRCQYRRLRLLGPVGHDVRKG
jgi:hypothetical protein